MYDLNVPRQEVDLSAPYYEVVLGTREIVNVGLGQFASWCASIPLEAKETDARYRTRVLQAILQRRVCSWQYIDVQAKKPVHHAGPGSGNYSRARAI